IFTSRHGTWMASISVRTKQSELVTHGSGRANESLLGLERQCSSPNLKNPHLLSREPNTVVHVLKEDWFYALSLTERSNASRKNGMTVRSSPAVRTKATCETRLPLGPTLMKYGALTLRPR